MHKTVIGFDLDGVVLDHAKNKIAVASTLGIKVGLADTPSEIIKKHIPEKVYSRFQKTLYDDPKFSLKSPPMPGSRKILSKIKRFGLNFFLISRRKYPRQTIKIMKYHKIWPRFFNDKNSFFVQEIKDKEKKAGELGITHYIDDEIRVLKALNSVKNKFLFDNLDIFEDSNTYTRINSWREFNKIINLT